MWRCAATVQVLTMLATAVHARQLSVICDSVVSGYPVTCDDDGYNETRTIETPWPWWIKSPSPALDPHPKEMVEVPLPKFWGQNQDVADMEDVKQALAVAPPVDMDKMEQELADNLSEEVSKEIAVNQPIP